MPVTVKSDIEVTFIQSVRIFMGYYKPPEYSNDFFWDFGQNLYKNFLFNVERIFMTHSSACLRRSVFGKSKSTCSKLFGDFDIFFSVIRNVKTCR